jgi:pre-60S factor REI1
MSSTFSLGESNLPEDEDSDESEEEEVEKVAKGIKTTDLKDNADDSASRQPSRPHQSASGEGQVKSHESAAKKAATAGEDPKVVAKRECLYCNNYAPTLEANVVHMIKEHGLFVPEREYLADLEGLILFLNRKVHFHYQCTSCNRLKWSEDGIKQHMRDMGHCKIAYETEDEQLEIGKFYDFRSTYSDGGEDWESDSEEEEESKPVRRTKLGAKREAKGSGEEGEGWETDSTVSSVPTEELGALYLDDDREKTEKYGKLKTNRHHARSSGSQHRSVDGFHSHAHKATNAVYHDEFELHLPTGRVAGHRSLNKYYRQNLRTYPTPEERAQRLLTAGSDGEEEENTRGRGRGRVANKDIISRANGGLGMLHVSDEKKRAVKAMEKTERRNEARALQKVQWRVNRLGNSQKHYRDPLLQ